MPTLATGDGAKRIAWCIACAGRTADRADGLCVPCRVATDRLIEDLMRI